MRTNPSCHNDKVRMVGNIAILTDQEGYIRDLDEWSKAFVIAIAREEGLTLRDNHWQVIRFIRDYYYELGAQAQLRPMIKHFAHA